jgi:deoxyribodipyrimidine photo-lyase
MIQDERIVSLNRQESRDRDYVLSWMQSAQRAGWNHALEYAIWQANERKKPVVAVFGLTADYPEANLRHYQFMLEGLKETQKDLAKRKIQLVIRKGSPDQVAIQMAKRADLVIVDEGYTQIQRQWRKTAAQAMDCPLMEVTTNLIVPVEEASEKENYSAGTLRPRISRHLDRYLADLKSTKPLVSSMPLIFQSLDIDDPAMVARSLPVDSSVKPSPFFTGGAKEAGKRLILFLEKKLNSYDTLRNDPSKDYQSGLSPYLHFGQISPLQIALDVKKSRSAGQKAFLEELIVRRELSHNFVYYNRRYDEYDALPPWILRTLQFHAKDKRDSLYTLEQFEAAQTHDPYWNAAQTEMVLTGKIHGYMRMYWGKKILEWSKSPQAAFRTALYLNNKYELDGRDPNGYAGVAWCFGKHDRPWQERPVFGMVRYMNAAGLKRKFNPDLYVQKIHRLSEEIR